MRRIWLLRFLSAAAGTLLALLAGEALLRWRGYRPWQPLVFANEPVVFRPDPVLGWRTAPGVYRYRGYAPDAGMITLTIWPDGSHATAPGPLAGPPAAVFVGDSFTQGWAVSDAETFVWRLQERFPGVRLGNYGAGGYNTYQSLLLLEEILRTVHPAVVVYGFDSALEERNVGSPEWLRTLALTARRGHLAVPFCLLAPAGSLACRTPEAYPSWPLRRQLATVAFLEERYAGLNPAGRHSHEREVSELLMEELQRTSAAHGATLLVVFLMMTEPDGQAYYATALGRRGVPVTDCNHRLTAEFTVPGEGHPNARLHDLWAACIERALGPLLPPA